jgi:hypothetical protein
MTVGKTVGNKEGVADGAIVGKVDGGMVDVTVGVRDGVMVGFPLTETMEISSIKTGTPLLLDSCSIIIEAVAVKEAE